MDELIMENRNELKEMFNETINQIVNETNDNKIIMKRLKIRMNRILCERKQNIMIMTESIIDDSKMLVDQWTNNLISQLIKKNNQKINEIQNNIMKEMEMENENNDRRRN